MMVQLGSGENVIFQVGHHPDHNHCDHPDHNHCDRPDDNHFDHPDHNQCDDPDHNKGIRDAGSTADIRMLWPWSALVCLGLL